MKDIVSKLLSLLKKVKAEKFSGVLETYGKDASKHSASVALGKVRFDAMDSALERALSVDIPFTTKNGDTHVVEATTRLLKSEKDSIVFDGRKVDGDVDFDLVYKWFKLVLRIEISFTNGSIKQRLVLSTSLGYGFGVSEILGSIRKF